MGTYDPYKVLELPRNFTKEQLRHQFKKMVLKYHPDRNNYTSTPIFHILSDCYQTLLEELQKRDQFKSYQDFKQDSQSYIKQQSVTPTNEHTKSKSKFDIQKFNEIFDRMRIKDVTDQGYGRWLQDDSTIDRSKNTALIKYTEPEPIFGGKNVHQFYELGRAKIEDFSGDNTTSKGLNYMDLRVAHSTFSIVDESVVDPRKEYKNITDLENDRANISHTMSPEDVRMYHLQQKMNEHKEIQRQKMIARQNAMIAKQYEQQNRLMLSMR